MFLSIGVSEERFWDSTPVELEPYLEAHRIRTEMHDSEMWRMGWYMMSAVSTSLAHAFSKNSKAEYIDKPILQKQQEAKGELTEDEKKIQRDRLLQALQLMQANFELNHANDEAGET